MGKFGKETKILLLAITTICVISFLLATGISFFLAKGSQQELLLHDYGVSGYQLNHTEKLLISAFTAQPNESDIARGKNALASIGYSSATSMQLLPMVQNYRNQTMLCLFLLLLFSFGTIYFALFLYLNRQHKAIREAEGKIREFLDGNTMSRIECAQAGDWYSLFHSVNEMAAILSAHAESQKQTKEFLQSIISDVSHQIKTPLAALKMYHEIIISHKEDSETVQSFSEKSQREIKRMEDVIYTLLKLARLDAGIIQMEKNEENLSVLMQDVMERFETWAEQDHKKIVLSGGSDVTLACDALWMSEAFGNIIKNGRMFAYDVPVNIDGSNHKANVISYEANQFKWSADYLTAGSISVVEQEENQVLVVNTENTDVRVGDVITLSINGKEQAVTVAGILSDSPLAREEGTETIFCSEKTFVALTGQTGYTIIDVQFQNGASIEDVKDIENIFTDGGVVFTEQLSQVQQQRNLYSAFAVLVYGFLSIIVAITIFHIMNTINMGVIAKTKQYGTMRAIGMSNQQLIKMIVAEAMTYAVSGIILGCIIGLPMHWVVFASLITNFWGTAWSIPIFPLALIIGIVLFTSFLAVRSPAKRLHDMAIVDTIKSQQ